MTVQVPAEMRADSAMMAAEEAQRRLIRPDFTQIGPAMPRLTAMIVRTLKG